MDYSTIICKIENKVALLTINRSTQLNALNKIVIKELNSCLTKLQIDKDVRVIVIKGSGEKAFVAGADIKEFSTFSSEEGKDLANKGQELLFDLIANFNKPVIAAINGYALGGGLELALACHIRVGSESIKCGLPEVSLGLIPGYGGTQRLAQVVGKGKAMEMILTTRMIGAEEALNCGLVSYIETKENLIPKSFEVANQIIKNSPQALGLAIESINSGYITSGLNKEIELFGACFGTDDFKEGTTAFLEKRKPNF